MKRLLTRLFRRPAKPDLAVIIARRAVRKGNRRRDLAKAYEARHLELMGGGK